MSVQDLLRIYDHTATSRTAPNMPGCSCVWEDDEDEAEEPVFCPMHEKMLRPLRWSTLAMMVVDYGAVIHATERALADLPADAVTVTPKALASAIEDHFATGRHGWSYTSCATAVVMALAPSES